MSLVIAEDRRRRAQILLCQGGACGNASRGQVPVPIDRLRAFWKAHQITPQVSLAVTSCLGPCAVANIAVILHPGGSIWLGNLTDADYDLLADWARSCRDEWPELPVPLTAKRFERWQSPTIPDTGLHMG